MSSTSGSHRIRVRDSFGWLATLIACLACGLACGNRQPATPQYPSRVLATLAEATSGAGLALDGADRQTAVFEVSNWVPENGAVGVEIRVEVNRLPGFDSLSPAYLWGDLNGDSIYLLTLTPIPGTDAGFLWSSVDGVQGGAAGIEISGTFLGESTNFRANRSARVGLNELSFLLEGEGFTVRILPDSRVISSSSVEPRMALRARARVEDRRIEVSGTVIYEGRPVTGASVLATVWYSGCPTDHISVPIEDGVLWDRAKASFVAKHELPCSPVAATVEGRWAAGASAPIAVWPRATRSWLRSSLDAASSAAPWMILVSFITLWVALSNIRATPTAAESSGLLLAMPPVGRVVWVAGLGGAALVVLVGAWVAYGSQAPESSTVLALPGGDVALLPESPSDESRTRVAGWLAERGARNVTWVKTGVVTEFGTPIGSFGWFRASGLSLASAFPGCVSSGGVRVVDEVTEVLVGVDAAGATILAVEMAATSRSPVPALAC